MLLAVLSLFVALSPVAQPLRLAVFDSYQRVFPLERLSSPATIVSIDETSLERYGQWPWPRTRLAQLIDRLRERRSDEEEGERREQHQGERPEPPQRVQASISSPS